MDGGTITISRAFELVALPARLLITTEYVPASAGCTLVRVKLVLVAPEMWLVALKSH
jgi:hypothetical protein